MKVGCYAIDINDFLLPYYDQQRLLEVKIDMAVAAGADIIFFPEYFGMVFENFFEKNVRILKKNYEGRELAIVAGSALYWDRCLKKSYNRLVVIGPKGMHYQDKLTMAPHEQQQSGGAHLSLMKFKGMTFATLMSVDCQMPEFSLMLKEFNIDLLLIPAHTTNESAIARINHCAAARAVELGCYVITNHLRGVLSNPMPDLEIVRSSVGGSRCFAPVPNHHSGTDWPSLEIKNEKSEFILYDLDLDTIRKERRMAAEALSSDRPPFHSSTVHTNIVSLL